MEEEIKNLETMIGIKKELLDNAYKENNLKSIYEIASDLSKLAFTLCFLRNKE